jgi:hypothetical protein
MTDHNDQINGAAPPPSGQPVGFGTSSPGTYAAPGMEPVESSNVALGIAAGLGLGLLAAGVYAAVATATDREIGYLAVLIGVAVSFGMTRAGKVKNVGLGFVAALIAAVIFVIAVFLTSAGVIAKQFSVGYLDVLREIFIAPSEALKFYFDEVLSWVFLAFAVVPAFVVVSGLRDREKLGDKKLSDKEEPSDTN